MKRIKIDQIESLGRGVLVNSTEKARSRHNVAFGLLLKRTRGWKSWARLRGNRIKYQEG